MKFEVEINEIIIEHAKLRYENMNQKKNIAKLLP